MSTLDPISDDPQSDSKASRRGNVLKKFLMFLGALVLIALGAGGVMYGIKAKPEWFGIKNENQNNAAELANLIKEVSKIIVLPEGETPTLATVTEIDKVKDQPFFKNAKNGDKVLVYAGAKKAYLYRPDEKRIIEVGVVNIDQSTQTPQGQTAGAETQNIQVVTPTPLIPTATPTVRIVKPTNTPTPNVLVPSPTP